MLVVKWSFVFANVLCNITNALGMWPANDVAHQAMYTGKLGATWGVQHRARLGSLGIMQVFFCSWLFGQRDETLLLGTKSIKLWFYKVLEWQESSLVWQVLEWLFFPAVVLVTRHLSCLLCELCSFPKIILQSWFSTCTRKGQTFFPEVLYWQLDIIMNIGWICLSRTDS